MNVIQRIYENVKLKEGEGIIEKFLLNLYFYERLSNKDMAQMLMLPIPIITAIKKEATKEKLVIQNNGITLSQEGIEYIENYLGYSNVDKKIYRKILNDSDLGNFYDEIYQDIELIFKNRPMADVTMDQSKCTVKTAINRVLIGLKDYNIIGKNVACIGDDDLISVTANIILNKLYSNNKVRNTKIYVLEKDKRIIEYISKIKEMFELKNIVVIEVDLRNKIVPKLTNHIDCVYTDTPYTYIGIKLFLSRAIECMKQKPGLTIYFSFEHKSQEDMLKIEELLCDMGLAITQIFVRFNKYEGAEILAGEGQLILLKTTKEMKSLVEDNFSEMIYTGEIKRTRRKYKCKNCGEEYWIGIEEEYQTIEKLKEKGCKNCKKNIFELLERKSKNINN